MHNSTSESVPWAIIALRVILLIMPSAAIRAYLLKRLPAATPGQQVFGFARARGIGICGGVRTKEGAFLRMQLATCRFIARTDVIAFIRLDAANRLADIAVQRHWRRKQAGGARYT